MVIQLLVIQIITFIALIFLLRFLFSRNLNSALGRLNSLHEENLVKETQLTEELQRAQEEKEAEIRRGKEEAAAVVEEAKKEAIKLRLKMEEDSKAAAEKIIFQGKEEAEKFREKMNKELQSESLDLALKLIELTFNEENKQDLQLQFINEIIQEISELPKERFSVPADTVKVSSSYPLPQGEREKLQKVIAEKLGNSPKLEEVVNRELISGLILEMSGLIIDGTLKNRLRRTVQQIKKS